MSDFVGRSYLPEDFGEWTALTVAVHGMYNLPQALSDVSGENSLIIVVYCINFNIILCVASSIMMWFLLIRNIIIHVFPGELPILEEGAYVEDHPFSYGCNIFGAQLGGGKLFNPAR